ncbi:GNAT family N-acetyltransferase [Ciceribacter thiooxidans]|uniref:GNAT family N-acetyltransferase n=1 Tax=Ciceribacter thiooxidans TaxID=1969821 RepID=A0ABV7I615_9HYPH|nr:GNAT family N-acetyltransferase [Ciceribacter thiooxidans]
MQTSILDNRSLVAEPLSPGKPKAAGAGRTMVIGVAEDLKIEVFDRMEPLETEWRRLQRDSFTSLHQGYDWCDAWVRSHGHPLAILRGTIAGETCFILPLEIVTVRSVRIARYIASPFNNINNGLFTPTFRARCSAQVARSVAQAIVRALGGHADLVSLQNMPLDWRGERHPFAALPSVENQNHAFQLTLAADMEATIRQLNAKRRRKVYRSQCRKIEAHGGFEHVVAETDTEKAAMIDLFFRQKAVRFDAHGLPNVFRPCEIQAFFRSLLQVAPEDCDTPLQLHAIRLNGENDGKIAAIAGLSRKNDHVICQFGSIDEHLVPDTSPGELLFFLMIEKVIGEGAAIFDFGVGDQGYKRRWCTIETVQHDVLLPVSAKGRIAAAGLQLVTRTKAAIKRHPTLYAFIQRLRARAAKEPTGESEG